MQRRSPLIMTGGAAVRGHRRSPYVSDGRRRVHFRGAPLRLNRAGMPKPRLRPRPESPDDLAACYRYALAAQESSGLNVCRKRRARLSYVAWPARVPGAFGP